MASCVVVTDCLCASRRLGYHTGDRVFHVTEGFVPNHNTTFGVPPGARRTKPVRRRKRRSGGMGLEGMMAAGMGVGILSAFMR